MHFTFYLSLVLSVFFFISYLCLVKKTKFNLFFSYFFAIFYVNISILYFIANYYTGEGINNAFIYHLKYGVGGAGLLTDIWVIVFSVIGIIFSFLIPRFFHKKFNKKGKGTKKVLKNMFVYFLLFLAFLFNPITKNIYNLQKSLISTYKIDDLENQKLFSELYKIPTFQKASSENKNLVFIYLESFEELFTDNELFPDVSPNLNELKKNSLYFSNIEQSYNTSWTIAGMVGSQCGIPLVDTGGGANSMHGIESFLPKAYCMGDFLKEAGYSLNYIGGAHKEFAGKGHFYKTHKFDSIEGRFELQGKLSDKNYIYDWGLYDDTLFGIAKQKYDELSKTGEKFGLFMINMDTHGKDGVLSSSCKNNEYKNPDYPILEAYNCVDKLATDFIKYIQSKDDNTLIVVFNDHYAMNINGAIDKIYNTDKKRKMLFMILDKDSENSEITEYGQTIDIGATVLTKMGFYVPRLGLGRDILRNNEEKHILNTQLHNWDNFFRSFWDFPDISGGIKILKWSLLVEGKIIAIPNILVLDDNYKVKNIIWQDKNRPGEDFTQYIPEGENSIYINFYKKGEKLFIFNSKDGKKEKRFFDDDSEISFQEIKNIFEK